MSGLHPQSQVLWQNYCTKAAKHPPREPLLLLLLLLLLLPLLLQGVLFAFKVLQRHRQPHRGDQRRRRH